MSRRRLKHYRAGGISTAPGGDTTPPTSPSSLVPIVLSSSQINLLWVAATDDVGVTFYRVYRDDVAIADVMSLSYSDSGLTASTQYAYKVEAFDAAGNSTMSSVVFGTTQPAEVTGGLLAHWPMDEAAGATVANDTSGNGHNGTLMNGAAFDNGAVTLNGALQYINLGAAQIIGDRAVYSVSFRVFGYISWTAHGSALNMIYGEFNAAANSSKNYLFIAGTSGTAGQLAYDQFPPSGLVVTSPSPLTVEEWHTITLTHGSNQKLYLDGALIATAALETYGGSVPNDIRIGGRPPAGAFTYGFKGRISDGRIYDYELTLADHQALHALPFPLDPGEPPPPPPPPPFTCSDRQGTVEPTYGWDKVHIVGGAPTAYSLGYLGPSQANQMAHDPVRDVDVWFLSGLTMESPGSGAGAWMVVATQTCPPNRIQGFLAKDPTNNEMVLWGGVQSEVGPEVADVWIYDLTQRDWHKLANGSASVISLRTSVLALKDDLETLRWNLWKKLEWQVTGKTGASTVSALSSSLATLKTNITAAKNAATSAKAALSGYELTQVTAVETWLTTANTAASSIGSGISGGTVAGTETDYRALVSIAVGGLRTAIWTAADSIRFAPPPRWAHTMTYNGGTSALDLTPATTDTWSYKTATRRWERSSPAIGTAVTPPVPWSDVGAPVSEYVLRDVSTVSDLTAYLAAQSAFSAALPGNTWYIAPTNGTGRSNWGRAWSSIVYDSLREQIYYRDGGHGSYHGTLTDHYDCRTGRWFRGGIDDGFSSFTGSYFAWGRGYSYGPYAVHTYKKNLWYNDLTKRLQRNTIYTPDFASNINVNDYDPDQGKWSITMPVLDRIGEYVPDVKGGLVSIHGWASYSPLTNSEVQYEDSDHQITHWTNTGSLGIPLNNDYGYAYVYDPPRNRILHYTNPNTGTPPDDLDLNKLYEFRLSDPAPRWTQLTFTGEASGLVPRAYREWVYISKYDIFLTLTRQEAPKVGPPIVWTFDPATNHFTQIAMALGPGVFGSNTNNGNTGCSIADASSGLAYDPVADICYYIHVATGSARMFVFRYVPPALGAFSISLTVQESLSSGETGVAR